MQAEVLTEAFTVNLESLVKKEYMDARLSEQDARMDILFAEQDAKFEKRFAEQDARFEVRFTELEAKIDSHHRLVIWTQVIITAAVVIPYLERMTTI